MRAALEHAARDRGGAGRGVALAAALIARAAAALFGQPVPCDNDRQSAVHSQTLPIMS
jgi:hypothetical protein